MNKVTVSGVAGIVSLSSDFEAEVKVAKEGLWLRPLSGDQKNIWRFSPWDEVWFGSRKQDKGIKP